MREGGAKVVSKDWKTQEGRVASEGGVGEGMQLSAPGRRRPIGGDGVCGEGTSVCIRIVGFWVPEYLHGRKTKGKQRREASALGTGTGRDPRELARMGRAQRRRVGGDGAG